MQCKTGKKYIYIIFYRYSNYIIVPEVSFISKLLDSISDLAYVVNLFLLLYKLKKNSCQHLWRAYYVPATVPSALYVLTHLVQQPYDVATNIFFFFIDEAQRC